MISKYVSRTYIDMPICGLAIRRRGGNSLGTFVGFVGQMDFFYKTWLITTTIESRKTMPLPCAAPVNLCPAPVKLCSAPVKPCPEPVKPCPAPVKPCPAPVKPCPAPVNSCPTFTIHRVGRYGLLLLFLRYLCILKALSLVI